MSPRDAIYLDSNAGAPLRPEVVAALLPFLRDSGSLIPNPSSIHSHGRFAKRAVADAREKIALSLGAGTDPEQLIFTSSGTEANQLAVRSVLEPRLLRAENIHWITTPVEHDSNLKLVEWVRSRGGKVDFLPVDSEGRPLSSALPELLRPETALISAVWVNNETGVISDIEALSREARQKSCPLHLDAAQAWGKLPIDLGRLGAQYVSFSGHKIGALAGSGVLFVAPGSARGVNPEAVIPGKQEKGRRGGTENVLGIVAMGAAAGRLEPESWSERVRPLREKLESAICDRIAGARVNGAGAMRVANTMNVSFSGLEGDGLIMALDLAGFSVSAGSACSSGVLEPSHVLLAMGLSRAEAMSAVRVSLSDALAWEDLERFVESLSKIVERFRASAGN